MSDFETVPVGTTVELERIKQERDALAAHAEVGKALVRDLLIDDITDDATRLTEWCALDSPATSLAKRDLIKQAEALERLPTGAWLTQEDAIECVNDFARELRQQAEKQTPSDCELECGAYGAYCKCKAEALQ